NLFFFSSRRRHTRSKRDWSSDVCSSDLISRIRVIPATCLRDVGEGERRGPTTGARDRVRSPKRPSKWRRTVFETNKKVEAALTPIRLILFESRGRLHP